MKKFLAILITIIVALGVGFAAGYQFAQNSNDKPDRDTVEEKILEISELATFEYDYTDQGKLPKSAKKLLGFEIPLTAKEMVIKYSGVIKMGPKLKEGDEKVNLEVDVDANKITVYIPHSEILSHEIDEDSMEVVYIKNGVFNSVTPEDTNELRKKMKEQKEKSIKDSDFLQIADEKAVEQFTTFLNTLYPDMEAEVEFK